MKRCGKSAPRSWQQMWQGKPHPEQDQIEELTCGPHGFWVDCLSCKVTCSLDEWLFSTEPGLQADSFLLLVFFLNFHHIQASFNAYIVACLSLLILKVFVAVTAHFCSTFTTASSNAGATGYFSQNASIYFHILLINHGFYFSPICGFKKTPP